jgi:hypothetical protein
MKFLSAIARSTLLLAGCSGETGGNASGAAPTPMTAIQPPAGKSWAETVVKTPEGGYRIGNPDAPIKLVEYGSRLCPTCGAFGQAAMKPIENTYVASGKVSFEFREFMVHGAPDFAPALLGRCGGPAPFFPILEQMLVAQSSILPKMESASSRRRCRASHPRRSSPPGRNGSAISISSSSVAFPRRRRARA